MVEHVSLQPNVFKIRLGQVMFLACITISYQQPQLTERDGQSPPGDKGEVKYIVTPGIRGYILN